MQGLRKDDSDVDQAGCTPSSKEKMSEQAWNVYMIKTIPQNYQTGDCGVYTLKYIECLALGHSYDGLCDSNMPAIRLKLTAEMMDELPEDEIVQLSDPNPRGPSDDKVPLQTNSVK
ncbi:unnamed protein product [Arabis nemorensis]|uniref:Ubiquitin-like protease family profile domain-containing protein n=1 Tax=Arabis nemorensis TaxID=586526 RepID=A0A565BK06_9BRAS|nr:unnamed protein product [Arabis nemorensis]